MTELLARAFSEIKKLPVEDQNGVAYRILKEVKADEDWEEIFARTTDEQWDKTAEKSRENIKTGKTSSFDEAFPAE